MEKPGIISAPRWRDPLTRRAALSFTANPKIKSGGVAMQRARSIQLQVQHASSDTAPLCQSVEMRQHLLDVHNTSAYL
jgi:hypothetical protein